MGLKDVAGQERATAFLGALARTRKLPPALLFHGPPGVGKAFAALEFARALHCELPGPDACGRCGRCAQALKGLSPDLSVIDAAYQAGLKEEDVSKQRSLKIDTIRYAVSRMELRSLAGLWKVTLVSDAHLLVPEAANAMLKALEEPPPRSLWILVTHQPERLLPTVRSRCQGVPFAPLKPAVLARLLRARGASEPERLAAEAGGSLERALALLESRLPGPETWLADPLAPFRLAEGLPKELAASRPAVEEQLAAMSRRVLARRLPSGRLPAPERELWRSLERLRRALEANANPRLVLALAALRLQGLESP